MTNIRGEELRVDPTSIVWRLFASNIPFFSPPFNHFLIKKSSFHTWIDFTKSYVASRDYVKRIEFWRILVNQLFYESNNGNNLNEKFSNFNQSWVILNIFFDLTERFVFNLRLDGKFHMISILFEIVIFFFNLKNLFPLYWWKNYFLFHFLKKVFNV